MKKYCTIISLLGITLLCSSSQANAQQLCMETREGDFALVKKLEQKGAKVYLTLDVVTINEDEDGKAVDYENVNPKLRTFQIDRSMKCCIYVNQEQLNLSIDELLLRPELILEGVILYDAKEGSVLSIAHMSCVG